MIHMYVFFLQGSQINHMLSLTFKRKVMVQEMLIVTAIFILEHIIRDVQMVFSLRT